MSDDNERPEHPSLMRYRQEQIEKRMSRVENFILGLLTLIGTTVIGGLLTLVLRT